MLINVAKRNEDAIRHLWHVVDTGASIPGDTGAATDWLGYSIGMDDGTVWDPMGVDWLEAKPWVIFAYLVLLALGETE